MLLLLLLAVLSRPQPSPREFVQTRSGAYSVIPVCGRRLLLLDFHLRRLAQSRRLLGGSAAAPEDWRTGLLRAAGKALPADAQDGLLTVCVGPPDPPLFACLFTARPMPELRGDTHVASVVLDSYAFTRALPSAKSCSWTRERVHIEALRAGDAQETLLLEGGRALEGLTSSFAVLQGGALVAARERVLEGAGLRLLLLACERLGVAVRRESPCADNAHGWTAMLLTSEPPSPPPLCMRV